MIIPIVPAAMVTTSKTAFWFFLASLLWTLDYAKQLMVALNPQIHCITPDYNQVTLFQWYSNGAIVQITHISNDVHSHPHI